MSTQALTILLERAEAERDDALSQLQALMRQAEAARSQADQLGQYRSEYQQRWTQTFARKTTIDIVGCYQNFGLRLDQAIDQQGSVSRYAEQRVERARETLRELEMRVASVRKLLERRSAERARMLNRQDQKATDEQAARAALAAFNPMMRLSA
ncbi:flagellar export protein FliJ [Paucibacter sp. PLA-PC-4]|uniref:flagellar export protein FliJ n=1 Tax=Paucibacter sp. PLA-PC-4 TaxID=2993655 RepID=UPI00224A5663|nr:flagellar export protein FliJ [Paucibacter sp. PLA-PC-4]MCX2863825.1 flagellar export protein FliJ [Paucibacter sp. PLA-PC-4]